eukprot:scaffold15108_cov180-Amphora_coffeaeformis.AAC.54
MTSLLLASPERAKNSFRRSFTVTEKIKVVNTLLENTNDSLSKVAREHAIGRSTLLRWMRQRDELMKAAEKSAVSRRVSGAGRESCIPKHARDVLLEYVAEKRADGFCVSPRMLYLEWCKVDEEALQLTESAARSRVKRFMRRNDIVMRRTTHHAQSARKDPKVITDWISYIQESCKMYGISPDRMANFDETDVQFAIQSRRTLAYKGEKTVTCRTPESSSRCTVMLGVTGGGYKFPPFVIFKGKPGARIDKELHKWEDNGYSHGCEYTVQGKAWMNEDTMLQWVEKVWKPFAQSKSKDGLTMLIIDQMKVHMLPTIKKAIEECGTILEFIPAGYTSRLQVCDIGLNKPFKDYMRRTVNEWLVLRKDTVARPDRPTVSHWIHYAWDTITTNTIINTWAHIDLVSRPPINENVEEKQVEDEINALVGFMSDDDPREDDILALRESYETSDEEDD